MKKNLFVRWLCLLLLVATVVGITVVSAAEPTPASDDLILEDMVILMPAEPTEVEKSAATELKQYLQRITGTSPAIYVEGSGYEPAIYIGATEYAKAQGVTLEAGAFTDKNGIGEGWAIKAVDGNLILTGGEKRGPLFAVYHLLEDQLGVHWWNLWEEYVPTMEDATLPRDFSDSGEPAFGYRDPYLGTASGNRLFAVRNRTNGWGSYTPTAYGGMEEWGRPYHVHTSAFYFPNYYEAPGNAWMDDWYNVVNPDMTSWFLYDDPNSSNPDGSEGGEMFAWSEARQERLPGGQICMTNETVKTMIKDMFVKAIELTYKEYDEEGKQRPRYFDFSPNDVGDNCECPNCKASVEEYGRSGHLLRFINMIAEHVEQYYPEAVIETLAYSNYVNPPTTDENGDYTIQPRHNVMIRLADSSSDILQKLEHPNNAEAVYRLETWKDICDLDGDGVIESETEPELMYWGYGVTYSVNGIFPNQYRFQSLFETFEDLGLWGYFLEIQRPNNTEFWDMKVWMISKLLEEPTKEGMTGDEYTDYLIRQFAEGYYGEAAADYICEYLDYMHKRTEVWEGTIIGFNKPIYGAEWLTTEDIIHGHELFVAAKEAVLADDSLSEEEKELFGYRVQLARSGLDKVILNNYEQYVADMSAKGKAFGIDKNQIGVDMMRMYEEYAFKMDGKPDYSGIQDGVYARIHFDGMHDWWRKNYREYLDQIDYAQDENHGIPEVPQQIYDDHPGVSSHHIKTVPAGGFDTLTTFHSFLDVEWDGDVKAVTVDYAGLVEEVETGKKSATLLPNFQISETKAFASTMSGAYLNNPIIADGEYHIYRFEDKAVAAGTGLLYIFGNDYIRYSFANDEYLKGDKVDLYLSMKIEGDPSGQDPKNYAKYYISAMWVVEDCSVWDFDTVPGDAATCYSNATEIGLCPVCGEEAVVELPGTKLYHEIVGGYTWNEATKSYDTQCKVCGPISLPMAAELPEEVYNAVIGAGLSLERVYDYGAGDFTTESGSVLYTLDGESVFGSALMIDYNNYDDSRMWNYSVQNGKPLQFSDSASGGFAGLTYNDLMEYNGKGYHLYSVKDVVPFKEEGSTYVYTWQWGFRNYVAAEEIGHMVGRTMDFYVSVKNSGAIDMTNTADTREKPKTYIDRMIFVDTYVPCDEHFLSDGDEFVFNAESQKYEATCAACGRLIQLDTNGAVHQQVIDDVKAKGLEISHIHDYPVSGFGTGIGDTGAFQNGVVDADSSTGTATVIAPKNSAKPYRYLQNAEVGTTFMKDTGFNIYSGGKTIGNISLATLRANEGKYVLYKFEDVFLDEGQWLGLFLGYPVQNPSLINSHRAMGLTGSNVDVYLSMKIEGDPIFDPNDTVNKDSWPVYYIDRVYVVSDCEDFAAQEGSEVISEADCENNAKVNSTCPMCGTVVVKEAEGTALGHIASGYTYNTATGRYTSTCTRCGMVATLETVKGRLPVDFETEMISKNIGFAHVKADFVAGNSAYYSGGKWGSVADADSALGKAARVTNTGAYKITESNPMILSSNIGNVEIGRLTADMISGVTDSKYHMYKIGDNVKIPSSNFYKFGQGGHFVSFWADMAAFAGKTVDVYVSFRSQGTYYYVDRIIFMDECSDYITDDMYVSTGTDGYPCQPGIAYEAECPHCHGIQTKAGDGEGAHVFTDYRSVNSSNSMGKDGFMAYCDYGCGATDFKETPSYNHEMVLNGTELPEGVSREHIVQLYLPEDLSMFGEDFYWVMDDDLNPELGGRPAVVRDRSLCNEPSGKNALNMQQAAGIPVEMTGKLGSHRLGVYNAGQMSTNANKGYNWYVLDDVVIMQYEDYDYMYLFGDCRLQIWPIADDLKDTHLYKTVDLYMQMKVEGDPRCADGSNPKYYWSMFMIVESCPVDEAKGWTITREATCAEAGEAIGDCDICGKQGSVVTLPKLPHTIVNGVITSKATCKYDRQEEGICQVCGQFADKVSIPGTKLTHKFTNYEEDSLGRLYAYCDHGCKTKDIQGVIDEHEQETGDPSIPSETPVKDFVQNLIPEELQQVFLPNEEFVTDNMILGGLGMAGAAGESYGSFRDVSTSDWFYDEVMEAKENGLIDGVTANEFRPNENLTVAQAVKLAAALHEMYFRGGVTLTNGYVNWYDTYVAYAVENGIVGSEFTSYGTDKMNSVISRTDFVAIFAKALDAAAYTGYNNVADNAIPDVKMTDKNAQAIYTFYRAGILTGSDAAGTFNPTSSIKRSEVAAILIRMYDTNARQAISLG